MIINHIYFDMTVVFVLYFLILLILLRTELPTFGEAKLRRYTVWSKKGDTGVQIEYFERI